MPQVICTKCFMVYDSDLGCSCSGGSSPDPHLEIFKRIVKTKKLQSGDCSATQGTIIMRPGSEIEFYPDGSIKRFRY